MKIIQRGTFSIFWTTFIEKLGKSFEGGDNFENRTKYTPLPVRLPSPVLTQPLSVTPLSKLSISASHDEQGLSARPCEKDYTYISEVIGIFSGDFNYWNGGAGAFKQVVAQEQLFELIIQGEHGDRSLQVDTTDHKPCKDFVEKRVVDFGIIVRKGGFQKMGLLLELRVRKEDQKGCSLLIIYRLCF